MSVLGNFGEVRLGRDYTPTYTGYTDYDTLRAGERIDLTAKEYALLDYFVRHLGEVVSRTLIAEHVWDMNFDSDSDTNVVDVAVRRLRAKLDDPFETKLIHTIRGVGYVFRNDGP